MLHQVLKDDRSKGLERPEIKTAANTHNATKKPISIYFQHKLKCTMITFTI